MNGKPRQAAWQGLPLPGLLLLLLTGCGGGGGNSSPIAPRPPSPPPPPGPTITTTSLPGGTTGVAYGGSNGLRILTTGGTPPYFWSEPTDFFNLNGSGSAGTACQGLSLNFTFIDETLPLGGFPSNSGTCGPFTVRVSDSGGSFDEQALSFTVNLGSPSFLTDPNLPRGKEGAPYRQDIKARGGLEPYQWSEPTSSFDDLTGAGTPGTACEGLIFDLFDTGLGTTISGIPQSIGSCRNFTVRFTDSRGEFAERNFSIDVRPNVPVIAGNSLPWAEVGVPYSHTIKVIDGFPPYRWTEPTALFDDVTGAGVPGTSCEGLTLDLTAIGNTTTISGTPVTPGSCWSIVFVVEDAAGQTDNQSFSLEVFAVAAGRNDSIATATPLLTSGDTTIGASISPFLDPSTPAPDGDFYRLTASAGAMVTVEINAQRLGPPDFPPLDSVIEIVDDTGMRFNTCRDPGDDNPPMPILQDSTPTEFDDICINDDIELGLTLDSSLEFQVPGSVGSTVAFYVHVQDFRGDARPDMAYQITITGAD